VETSVKVEEPDICPPALPVPLQLKFWKWGLGSSRKYFHGTQVIVTHLPYHGPYKASIHSYLGDTADDDAAWGDSTSEDAFINLLPQRISLGQSEIIPDSSIRIFPQHLQGAHSSTQKNGEAPSPSSLHLRGTYFHYPSPDSDVPSRSSASTLPQSTDLNLSLEVSRSNSTSVTAAATLYNKSISPEPIFTVPSPNNTLRQFPYSDQERSMIVFLPRRGSTLRYNKFSSKKDESSTSPTLHKKLHSPKSHPRRATAHGGRGKPYLDRHRKSFRSNFPQSYFPQRNPSVQATLRSVGIDDETVLRRDRRVRITCCREDARYCLFVHRLILMLSQFEEV